MYADIWWRCTTGCVPVVRNLDILMQLRFASRRGLPCTLILGGTTYGCHFHQELDLAATGCAAKFCPMPFQVRHVQLHINRRISLIY